MTTKKAAMSVDIFGTTLTITFSNGQDISIDASTLTPEIQKQAMLHGLKQKLVDAAAIARNTETGLSASVADKYAAVDEVLGRIQSGVWNKERATKPETSNNFLVRALVRMTGRDKAYVDDFLSAKTKEQRAALKTNPRVMAIIVELQAAKSTVDTDSLLGELGVETTEMEAPAADADTGALVITPQLAMPKKPRVKKPVATVE